MTSAAERRGCLVRTAGALRALPLFCFLLLLAGCRGGDEPAGAAAFLSGGTMGTTWHVTIVTEQPRDVVEFRAGVQRVLDDVNAAMSTYRSDSDLSRFNAAPVGEAVLVSGATIAVTKTALAVAEETDYAFNPAVGELVELWGFGASKPEALPSSGAITRALDMADPHRVLWDEGASTLIKTGPVRLDFSAIAKGYGVDRVAAWLEARGVANYLVEVGGELRTAGLNPHGRPWRVGIERPIPVPGQAHRALSLSGGAVATSGDYRNYRELGGRRFAHTIDPRTGRPVTHDLASVTVVAPSAMLADAYATALAVMGPEQGLRFANERALPVYLLVKEGEGFRAVYSQAFSPYL